MSQSGEESIWKGWLAIAKLKPFSLFISLLSNAFLSINNREMKSESGFSLAMDSQWSSQSDFFLSFDNIDNKVKNLVKIDLSDKIR